MNRGNFFRRTLLTLLTVSILLFASVTHAEIYTGEGSYVMSEGENLGVAKERAKADAMRNASEQAGVYVKSYARMKNFELEEDIIETMTANILKLIGNPNFSPLKEVDNLEGVLIHVVVKVQIDDSDINQWLNKNEQEKSELVAQNESLRKANAEQERQIAELKRQLANNPQEKEEITKKFDDEDKIFLSNQKVDEASKLFYQGDYNGAIKLHDEALNLNPNNELAYYGRGTIYGELGQYEQAIQDLNKTLQLNSNNSYAYYNRGRIYILQQQYERAIQDYNKAIQLNPNDSDVYYNRGNAYQGLMQYEQAIQDYSKAIKINPNDAVAYYNRGFIYCRLRNFKQAIADVNKSIELGLNNAACYQLRGFCYQQLGDMAKAQSDFAKANELGYNG